MASCVKHEFVPTGAGSVICNICEKVVVLPMPAVALAAHHGSYFAPELGGAVYGSGRAGPLLEDFVKALEPTTLAIENLTLANKAVLKDHAHEDFAISSVTLGRLNRLMQARGIKEGQASLPASLPEVSQRLRPHVWTMPSETKESPFLLKRLEGDVKAGTTITNFFMDVQPLANSRPMTLTVEDDDTTLSTRGVPDLVILEKGLDDSVISPFANTCVVVDWKAEDVAGTPKADWQVMVQAIVLSDEDGFGTPAFLTDLVKGFRCWIVVGKVLFRFHPGKDGWLTLVEGTALIRYFIANHGRMSPKDAAKMLKLRGVDSGGGSTSSKETRTGSGVAGEPPALPSHAAGLPSSGLSRWTGSSRRACCLCNAGFVEDDGSVLPSSPSSPLSPELVADYQRASLQDFAAKLDYVKDALGMSNN